MSEVLEQQVKLLLGLALPGSGVGIDGWAVSEVGDEFAAAAVSGRAVRRP